MKPNYYIDISMTPKLKGQELPKAASLILSVLHSIFKETPETYAIDLPKSKSIFTCIRVFAENKEQLTTIAENLYENSVVERLSVIEFPKSVGNFKGEGVSCRRFRIPTRKSSRGPLRYNLIKEAEDNHYPYFMLASKTNKQSFSLLVKREYHDEYIQTDAKPNSYGLASKERDYMLPSI